MFASGLMLPILILDVIRVSHRFVGPMHRLRRALEDLADGKNVPSVKFRKDDFWFDLAEDFNRAAARVNNATSSPTKAGAGPARPVTETVVDERCTVG
jgi:hypothetical protein